MPIAPGFSLVTHVIRIPAPGGTRDATCGYGIAGPPSNEAALDCHIAFNNNVVDDLMSSSATLVRTEVRNEIVAFSADTPHNGTKGADLAPPNVSVLVKKTTGLLGRKNTGRMYVPGIAQDGTFNAAGVMSTGDLEVYVNTFHNFFEDLTTAGALPYILHSGNDAPTKITDFQAQGVASTQRRRLRR